MARFYGTVQGHRGEATRLGFQNMRVTAQSYSGDIVVTLFAVGDEDHVNISVRPRKSASEVKTLYTGPVTKLLNDEARHTMMRALVEEELRAQ